MRGGLVQASIFCFLTVSPLASHASPILPSTTNAIASDETVLLWRDPDGVYLQFQASCADCASKKEDAWPTTLFVDNTDDLCGNATISVNGRPLDHSWEGNIATGLGPFPSSPYHVGTERQAVWSSTCITGPLGILPRHNALLLTFKYEDNVGFTVLLGNNEKVEILRLSSFPVTVHDISSVRSSELNSNAIVSDTYSNGIPESHSIDVEVEVELQKLQVLQYALQQAKISTAMQERKLIHLLTRDCMPLRESWRQCENFSCYLKSSWQKLPEVFWSLRYRFGLIGHARAVPICHPDSEKPPDRDMKGANSSSISTSNSAPTSINNSRPALTDAGVPASSTSDMGSMTTAPFLPDAIFPPVQAPTDVNAHNSNTRAKEIIFPLPIQSQSKRFLRSFAIILLVTLVLSLFFRVACHTTVFRRRRRDIASRREELRAQQAYRNAARRLRWRQWWEGRLGSDHASVVSSYSLPEFQHVRATAANANTDDENSRPSARYREISEIGSDRGSHQRLTFPEESDAEEPPQRMIQAEILGLRRVLEYVGQLVSADGTSASTSSLSASTRRRTRSRSRSVPPPSYEQVLSSGQDMTSLDSGDLHNIGDFRRTALPGLFSSASRGPSSPRASTMFSLETGSLVTLDTLDSLDSVTAPPSYRT